MAESFVVAESLWVAVSFEGWGVVVLGGGAIWGGEVVFGCGVILGGGGLFVWRSHFV